MDRRYGEWYVLESKLIEFHGPHILSSSLPSKRTFVNKGPIPSGPLPGSGHVAQCGTD